VGHSPAPFGLSVRKVERFVKEALGERWVFLDLPPL
jgi:hypothetical protein